MPTFRHEVDERRYLALVGEEVVGTLRYSMSGKRLTIEHTEIVDGLRRQGIARRLTRHVFDQARTRGLVVTPGCSYSKKFIDQHPEYTDVL